MAATFFPPVEAENAAFDRIERARATVRAYFDSVDDDTVRRVSSIASDYPWLRPAVTVALGQAGHDSSSPVTAAAAKAGVRAKAKRGFGWHSIGTVIKAGGGAAYSGLKATSRAATSVLGMSYEAAQGQFRNLTTLAGLTEGDRGAAAVRLLGSSHAGQFTPFDVSQSTFGVALDQASRGQVPDLGSGFFPGGEVAAEQVRRARAAGMVNGHAATPGRLIAPVVAEPGTGAHRTLSGLIDAAIAIAEPSPDAWNALRGAGVFTNVAERAPVVERVIDRTGLLSEARRVTTAPNALAEYGIVDGVRRTTLPEVADNWLQTSRRGRAVVEYAAGETSFQAMWDTLGRKVDVKTVTALVDARTPDEVRAILRPKLGVELRDAPRAGGIGVNVSKRLANVRAFQGMPAHSLPIDDLDEAVKQLDRFQRNAKLAPEVIGRNNEKLARATTTSEIYDTVIGALGDVDGAIAKALTSDKQRSAKGVGEALLGRQRDTAEAGRAAKRLTRAWRNYHREMQHYFVNEIGEDVAVLGAHIDGFGRPLPTPHLLGEMLHSAIPLPDAREIRATISPYRDVLANPAIKTGVAFADSAMSAVWKPFMLLRGAWTVRVVGEEQVRMAASGLDSIFAHPMSAIAWVTGRKGKVDITGEAFDDAAEFGKALSSQREGWMGGPIRTKHKVRYWRGEPEYAPAWAGEIVTLANDPAARRVAHGGLFDGDKVETPMEGLAGIKEWFWHGAGQGFRKELATGPAGHGLKKADGTEVFPGGVTTREGADYYIDTIIERVQVKAANDERLLGMIETGRLNGQKLINVGLTNKDFVRALQNIVEEGVGPDAVIGDLMVHARGNRAAGHYDRAVEVLFNTLMTRPTNYLSRSSTFRQFYWQRVEELLPHMDEAARATVVRQARTAGLDKTVVGRMERAAKTAPGDVSLRSADQVAKGFALDETRHLLYDLTEKSQWADVTRLVFPFGEAWKEILTRWTEIGVTRPGTLRRAELLVDGARGSGFFYRDEQTGEERFAYPGTGFLTQAVTGQRAPLSASVAGLNLFSSSVLPGFGPVVQVPASVAIPDDPDWDWVREAVLPFGGPDADDPLAVVLPPWLRRFRAASPLATADEKRQLANTTFEIMQSMVYAGEASVDTPETMEATLLEARKRARALGFLRGAAAFVAPSSPRPDVQTVDPTGKLIFVEALARDYRAMQAADPDNAASAFLAKYGTQALLIMQGTTRSLVDVPATREAAAWARDNPDVVEKFPLTYGLFGPRGAGEFDYGAWQKQIERGERQPLSAEQMTKLANARLASMIYDQAKLKAGPKPTKEAREWLRGIREMLVAKYPGYRDYTGLTERADDEQVIAEMRRAVDHPVLRDSEVGRGVRLYLAARDKAIESAKAKGLVGLTTAQRAKPERLWLRQIADAVGQKYPAFAEVYGRVFADEVEMDGEVAA